MPHIWLRGRGGATTLFAENRNGEGRGEGTTGVTPRIVVTPSWYTKLIKPKAY